MFKQLQKSFVKSAMLSFTAVLLVVLVAVNVELSPNRQSSRPTWDNAC